VPPFDVDQLAKEIGRLAADADIRRALGRQAHLAAQRYTWEEMTGRYLTLVRNVLMSTASASGHSPREMIASGS
jgi:glycosyltransferase involved in cell wall biosynthesis